MGVSYAILNAFLARRFTPSCFSLHTSGNYSQVGEGKVVCLHAMKVYMWSKSIAPLIPKLHTRWRRTGSFTPGKEIRHLLNGALGWSQSYCGHSEEKKNLLLLSGFTPRTDQYLG